MEQILHALDTGVLRAGDQLPGIRSLAEQIVISHNTVAKAYSELEHQGVLELRHGSGAFILPRTGIRTRSDRIRKAQLKVSALVEELRQQDLSDEEIRRLFEAQLLYQDQPTGRR